MRPYLDSLWTDAKRETLRAMWTSGASVNEIAAAIEVPRNSVPGVARRLGLPGRLTPIMSNETIERFAEAMAEGETLTVAEVSAKLSINPKVGEKLMTRIATDMGAQAI